MNRNVCLVCLCLGALLLTGCSGEFGFVDRLKPASEVVVSAREPESTPTPAESPTPIPTVTAVPTQMPLEPMQAEAFTAATPREATEQIRLALKAFPCYSETYQIGTYADYISYDEAHDSVCIQVAGDTGSAILNALAPLTESGKLTRLMLDFETYETISALPGGVTELILSELDKSYYEWLQNCAAITSLTICEYDSDWGIAYPPALKALTIESGDLSLVMLLGTKEAPMLPNLTSLTLGVEGGDEPPEIDYTDEDFAATPKLTEMNLWIKLGYDTQILYQKALALPSLKTLNGQAKTAYGPYIGLGVEDAMSELWDARNAEYEGEGVIQGVSGLPTAIVGTVMVDIGYASSYNFMGDANVVYNTKDADPGCFYGIPTPLIWTDDKPQSTAWVVLIYEYDEVAGFYGEEEDEELAYAVETRMLVVEIGTGKVWKYTAKRTNPPSTDEEDTYGEYCPLLAVELIRSRMQTDLGPYAGCTADETAYAVESNLEIAGSSFGTEGLPTAITGPIDVQVEYDYGNCSEEDDIIASSDIALGESYYGIPYDIISNNSDASPAWQVLIYERDVETKQYSDDNYYTEGYTVETHLILVEMATGRAWHRLIKSSPPPNNPDETNYGSFYPASALAVVKTLIAS